MPIASLTLRVPGCSPHALRRQVPRAVPHYSSFSFSSLRLVPRHQRHPLLYPSSIQQQYRSFSRTMSAPAKKEFLCILPDKPGAMAKRIEVRPAHLEGVKPLVASGKVVAGGAMLNSHPTEGETPSFKGSMMLAVAESEAEVRQLLANDIYGTSGVWDLENAQIIPFKSAVREQL